MVGNILGDAFDEYVDEQIKVRQKVYGKTSGRNTQELTYLNGRTAWARMISSVDLIEDTQFNTGKKRLENLGVSNEYFGDGLAKNFVLFAGTSKVETTSTTNEEGVTQTQVNNPSINNLRKGINSTNILSNAAYGLGGTEFGLQPMPHLSDISITNRGEYGAYREATINVKCYNPKQFEIINILYLSVGYTVLLEWGHNCYFNNKEEFISNNTTSLQQYFFDKKNANNHIGLFQAIKAKRKESDGNFDGLFGYVTNYTWTFENGVYNIDIKLTSLGSIAESLTINTYGNITGSNAEPQNNSISTLLDGFDKGLVPELGEKIAIFSAQFENNPEVRFGTISQTQIDFEQNQNSQYTDEEGNPIFEDTQKTIPTSDPSKPTKAYQTTQQSLINVAEALKIEPSDAFIGSTIDFIKFLKTDGTTNNTKHLKYIRFGALLEFIEKTELIYNFAGENSPQPLLKIDYNPETNFMATFPLMIVTDPFNCIFNSGELTRIGSENPETSTQFSNLPEFKTLEYGGIVVGKVMNVFLNCSMVNDLLINIIDNKGNINLVKFLQSLCDKISASVGHVSELKVSIDEEDNVLKIIENGELPNKKKILESFKIPTTYSSFDVFGYSNFNKENQSAGFVKSFNIKTQITNDIYTTAVLGAQQAGYPTKNVDPTNFSYMYRGLQDRIISYKQTISDKNIQNDSEEERIKKNQERYSKAIVTYDEILGFSNDFKYGINDKILKFSEDDILNYKSAIQSLIEKRKRHSLQVGGVSNIQYMPINFSMTLDGLSGMKIFQNFKADSKFLPYPYPEVITLNINPSIRHKISNNVWTTEVETKFVPEFVKSKNFIETTEQTTKDGFYGTNKEGIGFGVGGGGGGSEGGGSLKASGEFQQGQKAPPPLTPNADYLRGVMARLNSSGKNFKIIERYNPNLYLSSQPEFKNLLTSPVLTSNGDISEKLKNYASNVFENISSFWSSYNDENGNNPGGMQVLITAGNDTSHLESKSTAHRQGRGLDMTIRNLNGTNFTKISDTTLKPIPDYGPLDWVLERIQELIPFDGDMGDYLDEYRYPSPGATGPHLHLNTGTENLRSHIVDGVKYTGKKYAIKLKNEGKITSKPLKQISNIPPQYFV
jgi:hypothetical protein